MHVCIWHIRKNLLKPVFKNNISIIYFFMFIGVLPECLCEGVRSLRTRVTDGVSLQWVLRVNPDPLEEQSALSNQIHLKKNLK